MLLPTTASLCCSGTHPSAPPDWRKQRGATGVSHQFLESPASLDTPKCASCGSWLYEEFDMWLLRSERLAVPGYTHFLNTHLRGSTHCVSENSSTHRYTSTYWEEVRQMVSISACNQTRMQMIQNN